MRGYSTIYTSAEYDGGGAPTRTESQWIAGEHFPDECLVSIYLFEHLPPIMLGDEIRLGVTAYGETVFFPPYVLQVLGYIEEFDALVCRRNWERERELYEFLGSLPDLTHRGD